MFACDVMSSKIFSHEKCYNHLIIQIEKYIHGHGKKEPENTPNISRRNSQTHPLDEKGDVNNYGGIFPRRLRS